MDYLNLREPVSAWSHAAWLLLTVPGAALLWRRAAGDRSRQLVLTGYIACLACCAAASTLYHAVRVPRQDITPYLLCDHIGIYALIAGTYTPIAWTLLRGRWRAGTLAVVWSTAAMGTAMHVAFHNLPNWFTTGFYLAMGWGSVVCYLELSRTISHRALRPIVVGGAFYSVGALFHVLNWPVIWPGVIGAHEVFHGLVVVGSLIHFRFILEFIAPWQGLPEASPQALPVVREPRGGARPPVPAFSSAPEV